MSRRYVVHYRFTPTYLRAEQPLGRRIPGRTDQISLARMFEDIKDAQSWAAATGGHVQSISICESPLKCGGHALASSTCINCPLYGYMANPLPEVYE